MYGLQRNEEEILCFLFLKKLIRRRCSVHSIASLFVLYE